MYRLTVGGVQEFEGPLMGLLKKIAELGYWDQVDEGCGGKTASDLNGKAVEVWRRARVRRAYGHTDKWVLEDGGVWKDEDHS